MLNERLFLSFRHVMYSLRGGFLVRPLIIALALGAAGALLSARSVPQPFAPVLTILGAMLLALTCVAWLLFLGARSA